MGLTSVPQMGMSGVGGGATQLPMLEGWAISSPEPLPQSAISGSPAPPRMEKSLSEDDITLQKCKRVVAEQSSREAVGRKGSKIRVCQPLAAPASSTFTQLRTALDFSGLWSSHLHDERLDLENARSPSHCENPRSCDGRGQVLKGLRGAGAQRGPLQTQGAQS